MQCGIPSQQASWAVQCSDVSGLERTLLYKILEATVSLARKKVDARFRWVPAHKGIVGKWRSRRGSSGSV
jgi:hypothetical protein